MTSRGPSGAGLRSGRLALLALALALALAGCVARRYALPMTAEEQRAHQEGAALVAYLSQPGASGSVCDPRSGPSALLRDADAAGSLVGALVAGRVPAEPWRRCVSGWLAEAGPESSAALLDTLLGAALGEIESDGLDAARAARLDVLIEAYAQRPPGQDAAPRTVGRVSSALALDLAIGPNDRAGPQHEAMRQPLGPDARSRALALGRAIDPAKALGRPVDATLLDELAAKGDEATLRLLSARLRDEGMQLEARRRVVRLHAAASSWPEVRGRIAAVEEEVLRTGVNAVALAEHPVRRAWLEPGPLPVALLEQHPREQVARLLTPPPSGVASALFPEQPLRALLRLELDGLSAPVTLCAPPADLEVTPCLRPAELSVVGTSATLDPAGTLHLRERLSQLEAVALARGGRLLVPLLVSGRPATAAAWPLAFAVPSELAFPGPAGGGPGPALAVEVEALAGGPLVVQVRDGVESCQVVVERGAAGAFRVVSRGGRGAPGQDGWSGNSGADGLDGSDASCPSMSGSDGGRGGDGSDGGDGGGGGPGGPGGDVDVTLRGGAAERSALLEQLRRMVVSEGGAGGPGGRGGLGGDGGRGGRGGGSATCPGADGTTTSLFGGSSGSAGSSGRSGRAGPDGRSGPAGSVTVRGGP